MKSKGFFNTKFNCHLSELEQFVFEKESKRFDSNRMSLHARLTPNPQSSICTLLIHLNVL